MKYTVNAEVGNTYSEADTFKILFKMNLAFSILKFSH